MIFGSWESWNKELSLTFRTSDWTAFIFPCSRTASCCIASNSRITLKSSIPHWSSLWGSKESLLWHSLNYLTIDIFQRFRHFLDENLQLGYQTGCELLKKRDRSLDTEAKMKKDKLTSLSVAGSTWLNTSLIHVLASKLSLENFDISYKSKRVCSWLKSYKMQITYHYRWGNDSWEWSIKAIALIEDSMGVTRCQSDCIPAFGKTFSHPGDTDSSKSIAESDLRNHTFGMKSVGAGTISESRVAFASGH